MMKKLLMLCGLSALCGQEITAYNPVMQNQIQTHEDMMHAHNQFMSGLINLNKNKNLSISANQQVIGFMLTFQYKDAESNIFIGKNSTHFVEIDPANLKRLDNGVIEATLEDIGQKTAQTSTFKLATTVSLFANFGCDIFSNNTHKSTDNIISAFTSQSTEFKQSTQNMIDAIERVVLLPPNQQQAEAQKIVTDPKNSSTDFFALAFLLSSNKAIKDNANEYIAKFNSEIYTPNYAFNASYVYDFSSMFLHMHCKALYTTMDLAKSGAVFKSCIQKTSDLLFSDLATKLSLNDEEQTYIKTNIFADSVIVPANSAICSDEFTKYYFADVMDNSLNIRVVSIKLVMNS